MLTRIDITDAPDETIVASLIELARLHGADIERVPAGLRMGHSDAAALDGLSRRIVQAAGSAGVVTHVRAPIPPPRPK